MIRSRLVLSKKNRLTTEAVPSGVDAASLSRVWLCDSVYMLTHKHSQCVATPSFLSDLSLGPCSFPDTAADTLISFLYFVRDTVAGIQLSPLRI